MRLWLLLVVLAIPTAAAATAESGGGPCIPLGRIDVGPTAQEICLDRVPVAVLIGAGAAGVGILGGGATLAWFKWLRWVPAMGLFTRLRSDRLLDQPVRAHLFSLIDEQPGIHYQALVERTGCAKGQVSHHLSTLVRAGMLTAVRQKGFSSYFVTGRIDAPVMQALSSVKAPVAASALRRIHGEPGIAARALARDLGVNESTLRHHLRRFERAGLIERQDGLRPGDLMDDVIGYLPEDFGAPRRPPGG